MGARRTLKLVQAGSTAPELELEKLDGGRVGIRELAADGPALLAFFKVSCPVCQLTFPYLERLHNGRLKIYGVSQNDEDDTRDFNRRFGVTFPTLRDLEDDGFPASNAFAISSVPTMFLVETDGTVSRVIEGWSKRDMEWLAEKAGKAVFGPGDYVPEWKAG